MHIDTKTILIKLLNTIIKLNTYQNEYFGKYDPINKEMLVLKLNRITVLPKAMLSLNLYLLLFC